MYFKVLLPLALNKLFFYSHLADIALGSYIRVPFGKKSLIGIVFACSEVCNEVTDDKIKAVEAVLDIPCIQGPLRSFISWSARYNMVPMGMVLKKVIPGTIDTLIFVCINDKFVQNKVSDKQKKVINLLIDSPPLALEDIAYQTGLRLKTLAQMLDNGFLIRSKVVGCKPLKESKINLSEAQNKAVNMLLNNRASFLEGVTSSGKTEVYVRVIERLLKEDDEGQALIMLPEIALASHLIERFISYFGDVVVEWHSKVSIVQRRINWQKITYGAGRIVVGARSALFLPYKKLKVIVLDEEHDSSYKQSEGMAYNARDMSMLLAKVSDVKVILVSATPSLESVNNVQIGKLSHVVLDRRYGNATLPMVEAIDMRKNDKIISRQLKSMIEKRICAKEQVLLFLNRRGYSPMTLCKECGHKMQCVNCAIWLVKHSKYNRLLCHHCGYQIKQPTVCPACEAKDSLVNCGIGVEKLEHKVKDIFPDAKVALLSSDTFSELENNLREIASGDVDIILGTQVISKGYHFPNLTLVGVIDADLGLGCGDLRASERTYQLLHQVAGRCGRVAGKQGHVVLQTYNMDNNIIKALLEYNSELFYSTELGIRKQSNMPPYSRLASVIISHKVDVKAKELARQIAKKILNQSSVIVLGPSPAPVSFLHGKYRYRFLLIANKDMLLQKYLHDWLNSFFNSCVRIDIDPVNFM